MIRTVGEILALMGTLSLAGCVHVRMNTHIESSGRCLRTLDVSVPDQRADELKAAGIRSGIDQEMALTQEEEWEEVERTERGHTSSEGRYHRTFTKRFPDPEAMSDRMIEASFGRAVRKPTQVDSVASPTSLRLPKDEMVRGDRVHFDMKKELWATTFFYGETIQLQSRSDVRAESAQVEVEIAMPGKIARSNAHRTEGHRAIWMFRIADGKGFLSLSITSRTSNLPMLIPMGLLVIVFLICLPRQLFPRHRATDG